MVGSSLAPKWLKLAPLVEWIIKNPNFHWYPIPFLSEAVEASGHYFFENQECISKIYHLRIPKLLSNMILLAYFYLSELIHKVQFNVRYPVKWMLIVWPKMPKMPKNLPALKPKGLDFSEKRLHWASVVRALIQTLLTDLTDSCSQSRLCQNWYAR